MNTPCHARVYSCYHSRDNLYKKNYVGMSHHLLKATKAQKADGARFFICINSFYLGSAAVLAVASQMLPKQQREPRYLCIIGQLLFSGVDCLEENRTEISNRKKKIIQM